MILCRAPFEIMQVYVSLKVYARFRENDTERYQPRFLIANLKFGSLHFYKEQSFVCGVRHEID